MGIKTKAISYSALAFFAILALACHNVNQANTSQQDVKVTGIVMASDTLSVAPGSTASLSFVILPAGATNLKVVWQSADPSIATVVDGLVTGVSSGAVTITATTVDGGFQATCLVTVGVSGLVRVQSVSIPPTISVAVGGLATLEASVVPTNASNKAVTWSIDDPYIASVRDGLVTGRNVGTAIITVTTADGGMTDSCALQVTAPIPANSVSISGSGTLFVGTTITLIATVLPADAANKSVTWSSSNSLIATVANGVVTGIGLGSANITATTVDGSHVSPPFSVHVVAAPIGVTSVAIQEPSISILAGADYSLSVSVLPSDASDPSLDWTIDNPDIATISANTVHGLSAGTTTVRATSISDDGVFDTCIVTVLPLPGLAATGVALLPAQLSLVTGGSATLTATVIPSGAVDKSVAWSTSNDAVAIVSGATVTAVGPGNAIITVTTHDGGFVDTCDVTVTASVVHVTSVSIPAEISMAVGGDARLNATVLPDNATDKSLSWSSSNPAVATIADGIVHGVGGGTASITVSSIDSPSLIDTCEVTVEALGTIIISAH